MLAIGLFGSALLAGCNRPPASAQITQSPVARFTDVTQESGVNFKQSSGGCGLHYFVEQIASGATFLDANGDGNLDIYFPQPQPLGKCKFKEAWHQRLYLNDGKGHFTLAPNAFNGVDTDYGIGAAVGDYDAHQPNAQSIDLFGMPILVAGIDDLVRSKEHLGRDKDVSIVEQLRRIRGAP